MAVFNNCLAKSLKNRTIGSREPVGASSSAPLAGKEMWATRGVLEVKFTEQEGTLGAPRALWAEFNGNRNDHSEGGGKAWKILFCVCVEPVSITGSQEATEFQCKVLVLRSFPSTNAAMQNTSITCRAPGNKETAPCS